MEFFADLHIHSCLSPCGDKDSTPANICGMAKIKGLDIIALTDHNTARNLPAAREVCEAYGILLLPGMEITTREEVHMLGYFPSVECALDFGEMLRAHLPKAKNRPQFFGEQPSDGTPAGAEFAADGNDEFLIGIHNGIS